MITTGHVILKPIVFCCQIKYLSQIKLTSFKKAGAIFVVLGCLKGKHFRSFLSGQKGQKR
jgi:hypothetical protein